MLEIKTGAAYAARDPDWMTVKEAAVYLDVSEDLLYREIKKGRFPALRIGDRSLISKQGLVEAAVRAGTPHETPHPAPQTGQGYEGLRATYRTVRRT